MQPFRFRVAVPILASTDVRASIQWFETHLGFERVFVDEDSGEVARDSVHLHFWQCEERHVVDNTACRVLVEGIDALAERIAISGALHPNGGLAAKPWGTREVTLLEPSGACVTFFERVTSP